MINIKIQRQKDKITYFEIKGHAEFSEYGEDVICAAVSSVGQMTINGLIEILKLKKKLKFTEEDGYIVCDLENSGLKPGKSWYFGWINVFRFEGSCKKL